jgi:1-acyl-sn-glycerol-3-phosphate acyltransferase
MLIAALRSLATYVLVSLYVLVAAPLGMLLALLFRWKRVLYIFGHGGVRMGLALSGIKFHVDGAERLPLDRAAVYCSNHQSHIDPPVLYEALHPEMRILYKAEIDRLPILPRAFRLAGFIPVDRKNKEAGMRAIEAAAASLRAGHSFLVFPEGTRSPTDEMLPFKKGVFVMAIKAQAPVVPIAIKGGRDAMRRGSRVIQPVTISIRVGEPVETAGLGVKDRDAVIATVRGRIAQLLSEAPV